MARGAGAVSTRPRCLACDAVLQILSVTFPFFALVLAGYAAAYRRVLPLEAIPGLNGFVLYFALPCMLYRFGSTTPIAQLLDISVLAVYLLCALAMVAFALAMTLNRRIRWNDASLGALVAAFPNSGFMGVPLLVALLGPLAAGPVILSIVVDMVITSSLCVALSRLDEGEGHGRAAVLDAGKKALKGVAANPMPWAILLGALASYLQFSLPAPVEKTVWLLADAASPVALFTIGAVLARSQIQSSHPMPLSDYLPVALMKLVLHPLLVLVVGTGGHAGRGAAGPICPHGDGAGRRAAQRQQRLTAGRAAGGRQRAHRPHHPGVHRGVLLQLLGHGGPARLNFSGHGTLPHGASPHWRALLN
jgi:malonate transporter and related proteins